jgi:hypothetical protein
MSLKETGIFLSGICTNKGNWSEDDWIEDTEGEYNKRNGGLMAQTYT